MKKVVRHEGLDHAVERQGSVVPGGGGPDQLAALEKLVETQERGDREEAEADPDVRECQRVGPADLARAAGGAHRRVTRTRPHMDWWPRPQYSLQKSGTVTLPSAFRTPTFATESKLIVVRTCET